MGAAIVADSRGILDPGRMREHVDFVRVEPDERLRGIVQWFWAVRWSMPPGTEFVQPVLSHPSANVSVGTASTRGVDRDAIEATLVGVNTTIDRRRLRGDGWNVAAKLEPGALGVFAQGRATELTDQIHPLGEVVDVDADRLVADLVAAAGAVPVQVGHLAAALTAYLERADRAEVATVREVVCIASLIGRDRSVRSVADLAARTGWSARALQRRFREQVGVSPLWMIRRYRLIEAADAARDGRPPSWARLAAELGYADQAHLSREFRAALGESPSGYAARVTPLGRVGGL